jgi:hypothetical protein
MKRLRLLGSLFVPRKTTVHKGSTGARLDLEIVIVNENFEYQIVMHLSKDGVQGQSQITDMLVQTTADVSLMLHTVGARLLNIRNVEQSLSSIEE